MIKEINFQEKPNFIQFKKFFFAKDTWLPENIARPIFIGIVLGLTSFWNGAVVITGLIILFFMAIFSKHRLEFLIMSLLAIGIMYFETIFFMGTGNPVGRYKFVIGFLAEKKDFINILKFYFELFGILPFIIISNLFISKKEWRRLTLIFLSPLIFATFMEFYRSFNNHKLVNVSIILLNIIAANYIYKLFISKKTIIIAIIFSILMTISGVIDNIALYNVTKSFSRKIDIDNPILEWIIKNTGDNEILLTHDYYIIHPILLTGRKIFYGFYIYAEDAGYNTEPRHLIVKQIYGGTNVEQVKELVKQNRIGYIVIEQTNRDSQEYVLNEELINKNFTLVYSNAEYNINIYRTY